MEKQSGDSAAALASNVARLRIARRLTQQQLGERVGVSRLSISKIERGVSLPRSGTLARLAKALGVSLSELLTPVRELHAVRFRGEKRVKGRARLLARAGGWLEAYRWLEDELEDRCDIRLPYLRGLRRGGARRMARRVRDAIAIEDEPIRDICGLLEENGVPILAVHYASNSFFGLSVAPESGGPAIVVNAWSRIPVERRIFSAAHELGHLLLHPATYDLCEVCDEEDIEESEREADQFAGYLLMPIRSFDREWEETAGLPFVERVLKVKRMFRVSYQTVLRRLIETERANESIWRVFRARYEKRYGARLAKTMEPKPLVDADFRADRLPRLVRAAIEKGKLSLGRAGEILGISLREMRELASEWSE